MPSRHQQGGLQYIKVLQEPWILSYALYPPYSSSANSTMWLPDKGRPATSTIVKLKAQAEASHRVLGAKLPKLEWQRFQSDISLKMLLRLSLLLALLHVPTTANISLYQKSCNARLHFFISRRAGALCNNHTCGCLRDRLPSKLLLRESLHATVLTLRNAPVPAGPYFNFNA